MYTVRKSEKGGVSMSSGSMFGAILAIVIPIVIAAVFFTEFDNSINWTVISCLSIFFIIGIFLLRRSLRLNKAKNFKKNGGGIMKKLNVTGVSSYHISGGKNSSGYDVYYIEADDGDIIYCSDAYRKGTIGGTSVEDLEYLYNLYGGYPYDKKETHKQEVLKEFDNRFSETEYIVENGGFFKKLLAKTGKFFLRGQRETIEAGYIAPYREIDGRRISVGDSVDVYIDPNDPKNYRMDIDYLIGKDFNIN